MSDVLAIVGPGDVEADAELVQEIVHQRARRVTVLVEGGQADWAMDDSPAGLELRDRLAGLLNAIEARSGATVVGLAGDRRQLDGWRFDRVLTARLPLAA